MAKCKMRNANCHLPFAICVSHFAILLFFSEVSFMSVAPSPPPSPVNRPAPAGFLQALRSLLGIGSPADWVFKQVCQSSASLVIVVVLLVVVLLSLQAWPAVKE